MVRYQSGGLVWSPSNSRCVMGVCWACEGGGGGER